MSRKELWRYAFLKALPVMCSYLFLSIAYGILMEEAGFHWYVSLLLSMVVYTGAFQYMLITLLGAKVSLLTIAVTALFMNSRQTFYSLTFLDEFKEMGKKKLYMIHSLTDETYAVNSTLDLPKKERQRVLFLVAVLSQFSWCAGSVVGGVLGQSIPFSTDGIDFCMTALFVVIFVDQWEKADRHFQALAGLGVGVVCLTVFGADKFILPALLIVSGMLVLYNKIRE